MKGDAIYLFAFIIVLPFTSRGKTFLIKTSDENNPPIPKEQISRGKKNTKKE